MLKLQSWSDSERDKFFVELTQAAFALLDDKIMQHREIYDSTTLDIVTEYLIERNRNEKFQILRNYSDQDKGNAIKALIASQYPYGGFLWLKNTIAEALGITIQKIDCKPPTATRKDENGQYIIVGGVIQIKIWIEDKNDDFTRLLSAVDKSTEKDLNATSGSVQTKLTIDEQEVSNIVGKFLRNYLLELMPLGYYIEVTFDYIAPVEDNVSKVSSEGE